MNNANVMDQTISGNAHLSEREREVLSALSLNGRLGLTALARGLNLSKQVLNYHLKSLESKGVINGYHAIVDVYNLGLAHYRVFVKYQDLDQGQEKELLAALSAMPQISWLTLLDGDFDLEFVVWAESVLAFAEVFNRVRDLYGRFFQEKYFSLATTVEYLPLRLSLAVTAAASIISGGQGTGFVPDELDRRILGLLNTDGRLTTTRLAALCQVPLKQIRKRLDDLTKNRIILGFDFKLDHRRIGLTYRKVLLKLQDPADSRVEAISAYLRSLPEVIFLVRTIGSYDFEFELLSPSNEAFYETMKEFRCRFRADIKSHNSVIVHQELKFGRLP